MIIKWPTGKIKSSLKEVEELMIPPDNAERNWMEWLAVFHLARVVMCLMESKP